MKTIPLLGLLALLFLGAVVEGADSREAPNIILIVAKDLGFSELGCTGGGREFTLSCKIEGRSSRARA
jgi:hypothetical protein